DLNNTEISNILDIFSILNIESEKSILDINKLYYLNEKIKDNKSFLEVRKNLENVIKEITDIGELKFTIPDDLNGNLRGYQMEGYKWFKSLSYFNLGGILADEMGLGKTIQTITFLLSEKLKKSLVVVPTSLIYNWISEFNKFAPALKIGIVYGDVKERKKIIQDSDKYNILITTYGLLKNDIDDYKEINFEYLILDEGQNINNYKTQTAKVVREINSSIRFVLTGTPIENNLIELWSIFDFIMPGYLYSKDEFTRKFLKDDKNMLEELKLLISPYILKRNKKDVLKELPDKIENKVLVTLPKKQKELYDSLLLEIKNKINNEREKENTIELFSYLMKLRQMCLDPSLILESYSGNNGKLNVTEEIIEKNINEHKIVIFSQFTSMLKRIEEKIKYKNINYVYLDGSTSAKKRIELVEQFNNDENIRIFLISLKAGGTGLNLTSSDIVIHFDPWYNPGVHDQASDRAHRIGQKRVVNIYKLIAKDTIEETIYLMQEYKKNLINEVLENDDITDNDVLNSLSNEQIINIILR
ncbi:DEAD/DEAH box helicase, partial [Clostridium neonatale]